ncbi:MAG: hypothetical protein J7K21_05590 [Desulfurococcales archaeon]|nr:hypothetical protein [Desulfurococcales archaeon]
MRRRRDPCDMEKMDLIMSILGTISLSLLFYGLVYWGGYYKEASGWFPILLLGFWLIFGSIWIVGSYHKYRECRFKQLVKEAVEEAMERRR